MKDNRPIREPYRAAGAVLALAAVGLAYEVTLTRLFSLIFQYHYVFLIVSLAVLGLGIGAGIGHTTRRRATRPVLAGVALGGAILLGLTAVVLARFDHANRTTLAAVIALLPFLVLGWLNASIFAQYAERGALIYGADLLGAVIGLVAALGLVWAVGAFGALFVLAGVMALAAAILAWQAAPRAVMILAVAIAVMGPVLGAAGAVEFDPARLKNAPPDKTMTHVLQNPDAEAKLVETRWSPFARVDLVSIVDEALRYVFTDAGAGSMMIRYDPADPSGAAWLQDTIDYFPFAMSPTPPANVLILGSGAGKDVIQAKLAGAARIVAVEINPTMVDLTNVYPDYTGDVYHLPGVEAVVTDGRNYVERTDERFDLIYLNLVYSQAATPGAAALAENYIFTREALTAYWDHLSEGGRLGIVTHTGPEGIRLFLNALDMLEHEGYTLREALDRVTLTARQTSDPQARNTIVTVQRQPIGEAEAAAIKAVIDARDNLGMLYIPHIGEDLLGGLATGEKTLDQYIQGNPEFNYFTTTDDRPFFYNIQPGLPDALNTLLRAVLILGLLYLAFVAIMWDTHRDSITRRGLWIGYFGLIGAAFMLVEIPMIQRFNLLLGEPALALVAVIGGLLLGGGLGSLVSGRFALARLPRVIAVAALTTGVIVAVSVVLYPPLIQAALPTALGVRLLVSLVLLAPLGFAMGMAFPSGMRLVDRADPNGIAAHWGANAVASTLGSVLATALAMTYGFHAALLVGALLYGFVALLAWGVLGRSYAVPQL